MYVLQLSFSIGTHCCSDVCYMFLFVLFMLLSVFMDAKRVAIHTLENYKPADGDRFFPNLSTYLLSALYRDYHVFFIAKNSKNNFV